jgi:hypothetical protein
MGHHDFDAVVGCYPSDAVCRDARAHAGQSGHLRGSCCRSARGVAARFRVRCRVPGVMVASRDSCSDSRADITQAVTSGCEYPTRSTVRSTCGVRRCGPRTARATRRSPTCSGSAEWFDQRDCHRATRATESLMAQGDDWIEEGSSCRGSGAGSERRCEQQGHYDPESLRVAWFDLVQQAPHQPRQTGCGG